MVTEFLEKESELLEKESEQDTQAEAAKLCLSLLVKQLIETADFGGE